MAQLSKEVCVKKSAIDQTPDENQILASLQKNYADLIRVSGVDKNSAQAALIEHKEFLCMAFRGTDEPADLGPVHRRFWHSMEDAWEPLNATFRALQQKRKRPLFITGNNSLGGAMATIAAAKFFHEDKPFTSVYTFGQPCALTSQWCIARQAVLRLPHIEALHALLDIA